MRTVFMISLFWIVFTKVNAQNNYVKDLQGIPIVTERKADVKGSPYLNDDWAKAIVKLNNGITYNDNMYVKYNQEDDQLFFKGTNQEMLAFVLPVKEFTIAGNEGLTGHYKNGFNNIPNSTENTFFEILSDGTAQLLKKTKAVILETKEYNSPVVVKNYYKDYKYYVIIDGRVQQVKPDKKSIIKVLSSKQNQIEAYLASNKVSFKSDIDLSKIFNYYNSI